MIWAEVKAKQYMKRLRRELNYHNKGADDEERVQLPSLRRKDYSQALLRPRKEQRADALKTRTAGSGDMTKNGCNSTAKVDCSG